MRFVEKLLTFLLILVTAIFLSSCGTGSGSSSHGPSGSGSSSGSGSGGSASAGANVVPGYGEGIGASGQTSAARFLYANPVPAGAPIALAIQSEGTLIAAPPSPQVPNNWPQAAIDPSGSFFYQTTLTNAGAPPNTAGGIWAYAINRSNGSLTLADNSSYVPTSNFYSAVVDTKGKFLYAQYGTLPGIGISGSADPYLLNNMTIADSGKFLYLSSCGIYSIASSNGSLAQVSNSIPGSWPVIDPTGAFLWAITVQSACAHCEEDITSHQVDPSTGALTAVPNSTTNLVNSFSGSILSLAITK